MSIYNQSYALWLLWKTSYTQKYYAQLNDLLKLYFSSESREYRCPVCANKWAERKQADDSVGENPQKEVRIDKSLGSPPSVLALHLKRFSPNYVLRRYVKRKDTVIPKPVQKFFCLLYSNFLVIFFSIECEIIPEFHRFLI